PPQRKCPGNELEPGCPSSHARHGHSGRPTRVRRFGHFHLGADSARGELECEGDLEREPRIDSARPIPNCSPSHILGIAVDDSWNGYSGGPSGQFFGSGFLRLWAVAQTAARGNITDQTPSGVFRLHEPHQGTDSVRLMMGGWVQSPIEYPDRPTCSTR